MERPGFSPETIDFLWGIRMNNNRDWFLSHKEDYLSRLYRPMLALAEELRPAFRDVPGMACKVSRIYRDTRMPQPDGPYKDGLWISFRPDAMYWGEHPCLYFDLHPEEAEYGFVLWHPKPAQLERFRQRFMHKLVYDPTNNEGLFSCVGCGRCMNRCPIQMNIVKVMKMLGGGKQNG